jgi:hypothetical protein
MKKVKLSFVIPSLFFIIFILSWVAVAVAPPDGLANLPLFFATFPSSIIERYLTHSITGSYGLPFWVNSLHRMGFPSGYIIDHTAWFLPLACVQATLLFWIGQKLDKLILKIRVKKNA